MHERNPNNIEFISSISESARTESQASTKHVKRKATKLTYFQMIAKHMPNFISIMGSNLLLLSSGIHMAWGLWQLGIEQTWTLSISHQVYQLVLYSWYLTAIAGVVVGSLLLNILQKKIIYSICGVLLLISGIPCIVWFNSYEAILFGRFLAGFAHGILYMTIITHYAENSAAQMRGRIVSNIGVILNGSSVFVTLFNYFDWEIFNMESSYSVRFVGIFVLAFAVLGLILNYFLTVESVVFLMKRNKKCEAITTLMKLRNEHSYNSFAINREIAQIEQMRNQAEAENQNIFKDENARPLIAIILIKIFAFLTNNAMINTMIVRAIQFRFDDHAIFTAPLVFAGLRLFFGFIPLLYGDKLSRKQMMSVVMKGSEFLITYSFFMMAEPSTCKYPWNLVFFLLCYQATLGISSDSIVHVITSEAFAINKKRWSIAFATVMEYILHIIAFIIVPETSAESAIERYGFMAGTAIMLMIIGGTLKFAMPITNNLTLKKCWKLYRNIWKRTPKKSSTRNNCSDA